MFPFLFPPKTTPTPKINTCDLLQKELVEAFQHREPDLTKVFDLIEAFDDKKERRACFEKIKKVPREPLPPDPFPSKIFYGKTIGDVFF